MEKTNLPIYPKEKPNTCTAWSCFITGKMPHETDYVNQKIFRLPFQFFVNPFFPKIKFILSPRRDNSKNMIEKSANKFFRVVARIYTLLSKWHFAIKLVRDGIKTVIMFGDKFVRKEKKLKKLIEKTVRK